MTIRKRVVESLQRSSTGSKVLGAYRYLTGGNPGPEGQWIRIVMNQQTKELVRGLGPANLDVLEISGDSWRQSGFRRYRSVGFPDFDICSVCLEERFDLIVAEQVFEHLLYPYRAARNVHRMLRPGGAFLISTPFLVRRHDYPVDCSRWTEIGLRHFLEEAGFSADGVKTGSWGNRSCLVSNLSAWTVYRPLFHSLRNDPEFPLVVWALARKGPEDSA